MIPARVRIRRDGLPVFAISLLITSIPTIADTTVNGVKNSAQSKSNVQLMAYKTAFVPVLNITKNIPVELAAIG